MRIEVNGEFREVTGPTLDEALAELGWAEASIATALNGEFVPKSLRSETALQAGDKLEVLAPMQGG